MAPCMGRTGRRRLPRGQYCEHGDALHLGTISWSGGRTCRVWRSVGQPSLSQWHHPPMGATGDQHRVLRLGERSARLHMGGCERQTLRAGGFARRKEPVRVLLQRGTATVLRAQRGDAGGAAPGGAERREFRSWGLERVYYRRD